MQASPTGGDQTGNKKEKCQRKLTLWHDKSLKLCTIKKGQG